MFLSMFRSLMSFGIVCFLVDILVCTYNYLRYGYFTLIIKNDVKKMSDKGIYSPLASIKDFIYCFFIK